jgi:hypothetical protein
LNLRHETVRLDQLGDCLLLRYHDGVKMTRLTVVVILNKSDTQPRVETMMGSQLRSAACIV